MISGEINGQAFQLFVEIFVRHKADREKILKLKEQGIAAIEIDLSRVPADQTREFYQAEILKNANRRWLYNRHAEERRLEMCSEAEQAYGHIGEKIVAALLEAQSPSPEEWVQPVAEAGLADLIGLKVDGHKCFRTTPDIRQAAILYRHVLLNNHVFRRTDMLRWLDEKDLLKPAFRP